MQEQEDGGYQNKETIIQKCKTSKCKYYIWNQQNFGEFFYTVNLGKTNSDTFFSFLIN